MNEDYASMYGEMHARSHKKFGGVGAGWEIIAELARQTQPRRVLDYGSGKGRQYLVHKQHETCKMPMPVCYDPGWPPFATKPIGPFDAVICTDVMEHIATEDVAEVLSDIFSYLPPRDDGGESFAFFWISCRRAKKTLPDGRNAHLTIQPGKWWNNRLEHFSRPGLIIEARYETEDYK